MKFSFEPMPPLEVNGVCGLMPMKVGDIYRIGDGPLQEVIAVTIEPGKHGGTSYAYESREHKTELGSHHGEPQGPVTIRGTAGSGAEQSGG